MTHQATQEAVVNRCATQHLRLSGGGSRGAGQIGMLRALLAGRSDRDQIVAG